MSPSHLVYHQQPAAARMQSVLSWLAVGVAAIAVLQSLVEPADAALSCTFPQPLGSVGNTSYNSAYYYGGGQIETQAVMLGKAQAGLAVTDLQLVIAPACNGAPGAANLILGLYAFSSAKGFSLLAQTGNIALTAMQTSLGLKITAPLAFPYKLDRAGQYYVAYASDNPLLCVYSDGQLSGTDEPEYFYIKGLSLPASFNNPACCSVQFQAGLLLCPKADVVGDPRFTGFHGQSFLVKGLPQRLYSVLSLPELQLTTRFIPLTAAQSMNASVMATRRSRHQQLVSSIRQAFRSTADDSNADGSVSASVTAYSLPRTTAWNHDGLYMGDCGLQLRDGHRLLVRPGGYDSGFQTVELDGSPLPVSRLPVSLSGGAVTVLRSSPSTLQVTTAQLSLRLVNSDHFVNIESATLRLPQSELQLVDGLLGQTADPAWKVRHTAHFTQHLETDFLLPSDDLWFNGFQRNRYVQAASSPQPDSRAASKQEDADHNGE